MSNSVGMVWESIGISGVMVVFPNGTNLYEGLVT
jgi:hypothetical protein